MRLACEDCEVMCSTTLSTPTPDSIRYLAAIEVTTFGPLVSEQRESANEKQFWARTFSISLRGVVVRELFCSNWLRSNTWPSLITCWYMGSEVSLIASAYSTWTRITRYSNTQKKNQRPWKIGEFGLEINY